MSEEDLQWAEEKLVAIRDGFEARAQNLQPGQCPGCGAFRLDGLPPRLHEPGCQWGDVPLTYPSADEDS
jgi:hypothetical protein